MCGILGTNKDGQIVDDPKVVDALTHRGPDSTQSYSDGEMGFRISRLAIVNSEFDDQPSFGCSDRYVSVMNGEIYNYKSLALELRKLGHQFPEEFSDAAILPHMLEEYGYDFAKKLDGMFAIAIWDHELKEMVIYRDSIGIKPIYYQISGKQLFFGSEISSIIKMTNMSYDVDYEMIKNFAIHNLISAPRTIFKDIYCLIPGTYLKLSPNQTNLVRWHSFTPNRKKDNRSMEQSIDALEELLINSISDQLGHGISGALLLSGGLDSSLIASLIKKRLNAKVETYHLSYENDIETKQTETKIAREVANNLGFPLHELQLTSKDYFQHLDEALNTFSQPFGGVTSTFFISKYISERHKVCLTGDGADELFGSYRNIQHAARVYYGQEELRTQKSSKSELNLLKFLNTRNAQVNKQENPNHYYPLLRELNEFSKTTNVFNYSLTESQLRLLPDQVLLFSDHLGMAHGLEVRPPFLSKAIVEFSRELPLEFLIDERGTTKLILKELCLRYFDGNFVSRKKEGFMLPLIQWMKKEEAREWTESKLVHYEESKDKSLKINNVQRLFDDFHNGKNNEFFNVYRLAVLMHYLANHE
jgi:asparagine synthase (glutamine-hydrolysing)